MLYIISFMVGALISHFITKASFKSVEKGVNTEIEYLDDDRNDSAC